MALEIEPIVTAQRLSIKVTRLTEAALAFIGEGLLITLESVGYLARLRIRASQTIRQMAAIGADSLLLCVLILFFSGMVFGLNTAKTAVQFGAGSYVGGLVGLTIARELGPTLTGILVAARAGSAMAAEIGSMAVTEQIDAMRTLSVSPIRYLVVPRFLAGIIMLPLLTAIADIAGACGAFVVATREGVSPAQFIHSAGVFVTNWDLYGGLFKTVIFGVIITITCCRQGLRTQGGAVGVGRATTSAVVISIVLILVLDYFLSALIVLPLTAQGSGG
jgi:phospholipid/cholesterol/gamma-HCH transport system permease protein